MKRADRSDTVDLNEIAELFSGAFSNVYKKDNNRQEPGVNRRELVSQKADLVFTTEATRSVLEGVCPYESAGSDGMHPRLVTVLVDA